MKRILIVEHDKILAKLLSKKMENILKFETDIAYSLKEARLLIENNQYFLALLDINLPDAPYGGIVDAVLEKHIPPIVLGGIIDKKLQDEILQKNIIDYIKKGDLQELRHIVSIVDRLYKNTKYKVLIVDNSSILKNQLKKMVRYLFFQIITATSIKEALKIILLDPEIKIVLTDYDISDIDGLKLTKRIRKIYSKNELVIIVMSSKHYKEIPTLFLKNGATDYICQPFDKEEFSCRLNNSMTLLEDILTITHNANRDFLTGLYNRRFFFSHMKKYFYHAKLLSKKFYLAMIDIDDFKRINDTYGHDVGDEVIVYLANTLTRNVDIKDIVARFGGEEFCVVLKDISVDMAIKRFEDIRQKIQNSYVTSNRISFTISIGIVLSIESNLDEMINRADMLLYTAKEDGKNKIVQSTSKNKKSKV